MLRTDLAVQDEHYSSDDKPLRFPISLYDKYYPLLDLDEQIWLFTKYPKEVLKHKSFEELMLLLPKPERSFHHIIASSVIEVKAISISNDDDNDNDNKFDIYGTIHLIDEEGVVFDLYDRKHDNPETISNGGFLTITLPRDCAITASELVDLDIDLKDGNRDGAEIVKGVFDWDCMVKDRYDQVCHTECFDGEGGGSVAVVFVTYRHAVVCKVGVKFLMDCAVNVYGEIVAHSAEKFSTILFDKKQNESINIDSGTYIPLLRHVVIAPAFSPSFNVHVKLFNGDTHENIVDETIQFGIWVTNSKFIMPSHGPSGLIEVQLQWTHPYMQPHLFPEVGPTISETRKYDWLFPYGPKLVEIYSVSIAGHMAEDMAIWGSIKISFFRENDVFFFNQDKSSPRKLLPYQIVPLISSTRQLCYIAFRIEVELIDSNDRSISKGSIVWDERTYEDYCALFNRRLCSVVRSIHGYYAAIHYSVFPAGAQAMVRIYLNGKNSDMKYFKADGCICAQYNDYDYLNVYQIEYYQKKLYDGKSNDTWLPYPSSSMLLSESSVMVPEGSALMVDVNLNVIYSTLSKVGDDGNMSGGLSQAPDSFVKLVEFKNDDTSEHEVVQQEIDGSFLQIVIQVEWRQIH